MGSGSNRDHWPQIGWLRAIAGNGGGGARRGTNSRGSARQGLPEFGVSRVPGLGSGCDLAEEHERGMGGPPGHLKRGFRAWTGLATARGEAVRRR